jgi:trehalose synthase
MAEFLVKDCALAVVATGRKAQTLRELRDILRDVHPGSIYHHFWGTLLRPQFAEREYNNDFASWCHNSLHDDRMAERLAVIDPADYSDLEALRQELIEVIEERLDETQQLLFAQGDQQFNFSRSVTVVFDTQRRLEYPEELVDVVPTLSVGSIFYHFVDARRREPASIDDFRAWLDAFGSEYEGLSADLATVDPYFESLFTLRQRLSEVFARHLSSRGEKAARKAARRATEMGPLGPDASLLDRYAAEAGRDAVDQLRQLAERLAGLRVVHVNSTPRGGGVAEILNWMIPMMRELGMDASWEVLEVADPDFFTATKSFHNALQGNPLGIPDKLLRVYEEVNARNAERLRPVLEPADVVFIHDPQPAPLLRLCPNRTGKWIWRCHIDVSHPNRSVWRYLRQYVTEYEASIFSLDDFAQPMPHPVFLIPPSIDPLSEKNQPLPPEEVRQVLSDFGVDPDRPTLLQVSRFDRFKDPVGVIRSYKLATRFVPSLQLVLAGGGAVDDPEGEIVLQEVKQAAGDDPDIHVLSSSHYTDRIISALQAGADIVLQKSLREGFGLTVTEAMWKGKPVIGGNTGGIRLQLLNYRTGFLVDTPEGAAMRIRYLLFDRPRMQDIGRNAREMVRQNFLTTRHLREYLTLMVVLTHDNVDRVELA